MTTQKPHGGDKPPLLLHSRATTPAANITRAGDCNRTRQENRRSNAPPQPPAKQRHDATATRRAAIAGRLLTTRAHTATPDAGIRTQRRNWPPAILDAGGRVMYETTRAPAATAGRRQRRRPVASACVYDGELEQTRAPEKNGNDRKQHSWRQYRTAPAGKLRTDAHAAYKAAAATWPHNRPADTQRLHATPPPKVTTAPPTGKQAGAKPLRFFATLRGNAPAPAGTEDTHTRNDGGDGRTRADGTHETTRAPAATAGRRRRRRPVASACVYDGELEQTRPPEKNIPQQQTPF